MKFLITATSIFLMAGSASAATKLNGEPAAGSIKKDETVYYNSRSCSQANPAKPFKVLLARNGRRIELGCFSEAEARTK